MGTGKKPKKQSDNLQLVIYRHPKGIPFPPRYRCKIRVGLTGNILAASSPGVYFVNGNNLFHPFSGGSWPGVLVASIATLNPSGFSNLCSASGPYKRYRVYGSEMKVKMTSGALTDIVTYTLNAPAGSVPTSVSDALAEDRCVKAVTQGGAKSTTLSLSLDTHTWAGITKGAIQDDVTGILSADYNASPTKVWSYFVCWTTSNGGTLGAAMSYEVSVIYDVEFSELLTGALLDN